MEDWAILKRTYTELHPGLERYNSPAELDRAFDVLKQEWRSKQDLRSVYLSLSEFLAKIKCGHTYANFFNQTDEVKAELFDQPNKPPFTFQWLNHRMIVVRDFTEFKNLPAGTEILKINGVKSSDVLAKLMKVARADGNNDAKRVDYLEISGAGKYEAFDIFYPLYFLPDSYEYQLEIRSAGSPKTQEIFVAGVAESARIVAEAAPPKDGPIFNLKFPRPDVAMLSMPSWAMYNSRWNWREYVRNTLTNLKAPNLVIDLRGNEGGDSVGDEILRYLVKKEVATEMYQRYTKYRSVPNDLRPYLETWDQSFFNWGTSASWERSGFYRLTRFDDLRGRVVKPMTEPYQGKVFVIVGPTNSSATFEFASQMKQLKLGTLVGRPTGGNQRGINGGAFFFLRLPNSKLEVDVPLIAQFFPGQRPDAGIKPDVFVEATAADIAEGRDVELAKVLDLAKP